MPSSRDGETPVLVLTPYSLTDGYLFGQRQGIAVDAANRGPFALVVNSLHDDVHKVMNRGVGNFVGDTARSPRATLLMIDHGEGGGLDVCRDFANPGEVVQEPAGLE